MPESKATIEVPPSILYIIISMLYLLPSRTIRLAHKERLKWIQCRKTPNPTTPLDGADLQSPWLMVDDIDQIEGSVSFVVRLVACCLLPLPLPRDGGYEHIGLTVFPYVDKVPIPMHSVTCY